MGSSPTPALALWALLAFLAETATVEAAPRGQRVGAADVLEGIRRHDESIHVVHVLSHWTDAEGGEPIRSNDQELDADWLSRIKVRGFRFHRQATLVVPKAAGETLAEEGSASGHLMDEVWNSYDGHVTIEGRSFISKKSRQPFLRVSIRDDPGPAVRTQHSQRQPLYFITQVLATALKEALADGRPVSVTPGEPAGRYEVEVPRPAYHNVLTATVDSTQGWRATAGRVIDEQGALIHEYRAEYQEAAPGIWLPSRGELLNHTAIDPSGANRTDTWQFEVTGFSVNASEPDDSIYSPRLPPGTRVHDHRHQTRYVVGGDSFYDQNVGRLASPSWASGPGDEAAGGVAQATGAKSDSGRFLGALLLLGLIVGGVTVAVAAYWLGRRSAAGARGAT
jgi:hypothetical protein